MRTLITGGAGFLGAAFARRLAAEGAVEALDDLSTGRRENLYGLRGVTLCPGSVLDPALVDARVRGADRVIHLAAVVGVRRVLEEPATTLETNVQGTLNVLRAAARHGRPVLYASSSEVYGRSPDVPFREDAELLVGATTERRWSYAASKAMGEWAAASLAAREGLRALGVRLFNVVGPGQRSRYGMVLPTFARQALAGEPLTVFGDGTQTRCFLHVEDAVEGCLALLAEPRAEGRVVNLGSTEEVSIGELARRVRREAGSASPIVHMPFREAYGTDGVEPGRRVPDVALARDLIGFRPRHDLRAIVRDVLAGRAAARRARPAQAADRPRG